MIRKVRDYLREPRQFTVPCTVEIERSFDSLHAHAIPEGVTLRPGDRVVVNDLPDDIGRTGTTHFQTTATVLRANPLTQWWTELRSVLELGELYHCGFEPKDAFEEQPA